MSNTGKIKATNGRQQQQQCANIATSTNLKGFKKVPTTTSLAASTSSSIERTVVIPTTTAKLSESTIGINNEQSNTNTNSSSSSSSNNNHNSSINSIPNNSNKTSTTTKLHYRTNSTAKLQHQPSNTISCNNNTTSINNHNSLQQQLHLMNNNNHRRDPHKYQYASPQTLPPPLQQLTNNRTQLTATDECDGKDNYLVYYDNELISGKLESLIDHMVPTSDYYPQHNYIFAFLLSARLFLRPHELLSQISQTWERQQQQISNVTISHDIVDDVQKFNNITTTTIGIASAAATTTTTTTTSASPLLLRKTNTTTTTTSTTTTTVVPSDVISGSCEMSVACGIQRTLTQKSAHNCIRLLSEWIETFPYDFRDERLMQQVRILARKCIYIDTTLGKKVSQILQLLVQRLTALEKYEEFLQSLMAHNEQQQQSSSSSSAQQSYGINNIVSGNTTTTINNLTATATIGSIAMLHQNQHQQQNPSFHHNQQFNPQHFNQQQQQANVGSFYNSYNNSSSSNNSSNQFHHYQQPKLTTQQQHNPYSFQNPQSQQFSTLPAAINDVSSSTNTLLSIIDICSSCAQLAHQLTAIELERLSHIGPEEFVQAFAKEYQQTKKIEQHNTSSNNSSSSSQQNSSNNSLNDMKKTRNLESYVEWFNRLSYLTATEIVKYSKKKQRVRVIEYWIETARECFNIGNFNSLMAIIAGLNLAPISRLKKTWAKVQSAKFSVLEHQMDPTSNFNSYRSTLKAAMWRFDGATDERERIIIPFFSLFVKDLYFFNEGCSNRLPNSHINFEKCSHLAKQVMDFNEWKQVSCPFEKLPNVISFLQMSNVLNENTLSMASFECEPPDNTEEKGRYKTVKAESRKQLLQQLQGNQQQH